MAIFNSPITDKTSYGLVAINIATRFNFNTILPIGQPSGNIPKNIIEKLNSTTDIDLYQPSIRLYHQFDLQTVGKGKRIGYTIFELDTFNRVEKAHLNSVDEIWVCTEWAKKVIQDNGINIPTKVVPLGVDSNIFYPVDYTPNDYIFLSAGKWEVRKSQDEIVAAFNAAFKPTDPVQLWLSMYNGFMDLSSQQLKKNSYFKTPMGEAGRIKSVGPFDKQEALARIMNMSSCGVFPSKAEGWGLETLEMMACGKPVIVTDYAGHTEFCNSNNSHLIPVSGIEPAYDGKWFFKQGNWCKFNIDTLIESMRENYKIGNIKNKNGIKTAQEFSWENTVAKIRRALE